MRDIEAVISDFGGVLTSPLVDSFAAFQESTGISLEDLGMAMADVAARLGVNPLFELERGRMSEVDFLGELSDELRERLGRPVQMDDFGALYFAHLTPNEPMIDYMRKLRDRGYRLALCTNNVREWDARWRSMLAVDELFEIVVVSAFEGMRKPEPEIYQLTLERLAVPASATVFVDDVDVNCAAAQEAGMRAVQFRDTEQAIAEIEAALSRD